MMRTQTAQSGIWIEHTNHKVTACKNGHWETVTATWQNVGGGVISDSLVLSFQGGIHINYLYFFRSYIHFLLSKLLTVSFKTSYMYGLNFNYQNFIGSGSTYIKINLCLKWNSLTSYG